MSRCNHCEGKGWVEGYHGGSASWTPTLQQCYKRCNIEGYSKEVQRRMNTPGLRTDSPVIETRQVERIVKNNVIRLHFYD